MAKKTQSLRWKIDISWYYTWQKFKAIKWVLKELAPGGKNGLIGKPKRLTPLIINFAIKKGSLYYKHHQGERRSLLGRPWLNEVIGKYINRVKFKATPTGIALGKYWWRQLWFGLQNPCHHFLTGTSSWEIELCPINYFPKGRAIKVQMELHGSQLEHGSWHKDPWIFLVRDICTRLSGNSKTRWRPINLVKTKGWIALFWVHVTRCQANREELKN